MSCVHLAVNPDPSTDPRPDATNGCPECLALGKTDWVHLRLCLTCGHVGCCDSSPRRHATRHFTRTAEAGAAHPVIRSFEPGEIWRWCYLDEALG